MKKRVLRPESGGWADHETAYSDGVVIETPDYKRVFISGTTSDADTVADQTRDVLSDIEARLSEFGGEMNDIVRVRVYVSTAHLDETSLETIHEIRNEFFDRQHYPASTLLGIDGFVQDEYLIEIDAEAVIPSDGWESTVID